MPKSKAAPIQVQKFLKGIHYPASRNDLIQQAKKNKADNDIINLLENLVGDTFKSPAEVSKAIGEDD